MLKWQTDRSTYYRTPRTDTYPVRPIALERRSEVVLDRIHVAAPTAREQHRVVPVNHQSQRPHGVVGTQPDGARLGGITRFHE